ncbi:hypothetical protein [Microbulbifer marinus]|uniref:Uncharacterized protein n=1 Tax=Microbulbifer marinus TaxID=658218 RepID=A0A1H3WFP2_9GAMM|nr:hypothetical protein [Microbulbifer marinus]SDZ85956.1 hypothetical protein SAMN05216562_0820 [Microbulbifer marinus]
MEPGEPEKPSGDELQEELLLSGDFHLCDPDGKALIRVAEIDRFPASVAAAQDEDDIAVQHGRQLVADLFKTGVSIPGKTVQIVFDERVMKGFYDGALEIVPAAGGGARVMARDVASKKIAGHGRIVEAGRVRQVAAGAFHLVSIAVAQSHLADINRSLKEISSAINDVKTHLNNQDKARMQGTQRYLQYLLGVMNGLESPEQVPTEKKVQLEAIHRDTLEWAEQLRLEVDALKAKIARQEDVDSFGGTEYTFKALCELAQSAQHLIDKRNLLLRILVSLQVGKAYLNPLNEERLSFEYVTQSVADLELTQATLGVLRDRTLQLLAKALFNRSSTLDERRAQLLRKQEELLTLAQTGQEEYASIAHSLGQHYQRLRENNREVRMALEFDAAGEVRQLALV